jgi:GNAT superfamily N-acetyltransferase
MPSLDVVVENPISRTVRVQQVEGIFDLPEQKISRSAWRVDLPLEEKDWQIGLIFGPSGSGKSTIAGRVFSDHLISEYAWTNDAVVDNFPAAMSIKDIVALLNAVGFSSPPNWLRPYHVLSNGEKFRAFVARVLAEKREFAVVDEFTSVVDRTVARIGSAAVAKTIRRRGGRFVAITCHNDIEAWLQPDWTYCPASNHFRWRSLQRRPEIKLEIYRVHHSAWQFFSRHHYLTADLHRSATCFVGYVEGYPAVFHSYLPFVGKLSHGKAVRGHRSVCLPDFQGVGLGHTMITSLASLWKALGYRVFRNSGHPAEIAAASRSSDWHMIRPPKLNPRGGGRLKHLIKSRAADRLTASFEYVGTAGPLNNAQALIERFKV